MYTLNNLMVGLDLTEMDDTLIRYAAFLCTKTPINNVLFVHIEKTLDVPSEILHHFKGETSAAQELKTQLENKVRPFFSDQSGVQIEVEVEEGNAVKGLLRWSRHKEIDLLLVGRKLHLRGSGVLPQKLLRSGKTSILFLPENAAPVLNRIMVSLDFSEYSMMALDRMLHSALKRPDVEISCLHVYEVPTGYITLGEKYSDFEDKIKGYATEKFDKVLADFPELGSRTCLNLVKMETEDNIGELIVMHAKRFRADMLVLGAKGKSAAAVFMVGSVTEKILRHDSDIPLVIFKKEKEETSFLDALLGDD